MIKDELSCLNADMSPDMPEMQESSFPSRVSLAMMYVPYQRFENLYEPEKALERGTLFADLDLPFYGSKKGAWKK